MGVWRETHEFIIPLTQTLGQRLGFGGDFSATRPRAIANRHTSTSATSPTASRAGAWPERHVCSRLRLHHRRCGTSLLFRVPFLQPENGADRVAVAFEMPRQFGRSVLGHSLKDRHGSVLRVNEVKLVWRELAKRRRIFPAVLHLDYDISLSPRVIWLAVCAIAPPAQNAAQTNAATPLRIASPAERSISGELYYKFRTHAWVHNAGLE